MVVVCRLSRRETKYKSSDGRHVRLMKACARRRRDAPSASPRALSDVTFHVLSRKGIIVTLFGLVPQSIRHTAPGELQQCRIHMLNGVALDTVSSIFEYGCMRTIYSGVLLCAPHG